MADELNIPTHRWYQPRNNISLPNSDFSKQWIYDSGIQKIDRWINSQPWGNPINALFALAEPGVWFDPSDLTTLFQDPAGTTPVTAPGNTVGLMLDKSRGLVLGAELVSNPGPFTTTTGWASGQGATLSAVSSKLRVSGNGSTTFPYASFAFSSVVGRVYKFVATATYVSGTDSAFIQKAEGASGTVGFVGTTASAVGTTKTITAYFSATTTTTQIQLVGSAANAVYDWDNISVRELAGNHATQATLAARPTYSIEPVGGRRNLLTFSEQFDNAAWVKYRSAVTVNAATAPNSTMTATKLVPAAGLSPGFIYYNAAIPLPVGTVTTTSVYVKAAELGFAFIANNNNASSTASGVCINLTTGALTNQGGSGTYSAVSVGNGWWRVSVTSTTTTTTLNSPEVSPLAAAGSYATYTGDGTSGIYIWGAQQEVGSTATAYQRVTTQHDVTEAGVASVGYLYFDGAGDFMFTSTITPGTDKAQVFAGVRKLSDAAITMLAEFSPILNSNTGAFYITAPHTVGATYGFSSKGSLPTAGAIATASGYAAPITNVLTALGDISGDLSTLRLNGTQVAQVTTDQGTGNYLAYPLYIGGRAGTSLFFTGHIYSLVVRFGANLDGTLISNTETWVAGKTGVTL